MAAGTVTLSVLISGFSMDWIFYGDEDEEGDSYYPYYGGSPRDQKSLQFSIGVGIIPPGHFHLEGLLDHNSSSTRLGMGISYFPPVGSRTYLDIGGEAVWISYPSTKYYYEYDEYGDYVIESDSEVSLHLGAGMLISRHVSFGFQGYYRRTMRERYTQDWFGGRLRLLFLLPPAK